MKLLLIFILPLYLNSVWANYNSRYYFTNNTTEPMIISSDTKFDTGLTVGKHYQAFTGQVEPYAKVKILDVSRDDGIKNSKNYNFYFKVSNDKNKTLANYEVALHGSLVGSTLKNYRQILNQQKIEVGRSEGLEKETINDGETKLRSFVYDWLPEGKVHDNVHFLLDDDKKALDASLTDKELKILSYNVQLMPFYTGTVNKLNNSYDRAHNIPKIIAGDYDVVIVQELFDLELRIQFSNKMLAQYPYQTKVLANNTDKPLTGGVKIFSKWPILKEQEMVYKNCNDIDCQAAKGAKYAVISKNGEPYHIFGTHTQAYSGVVGLQLQQLADYVKQQNIPSDEAVIVSGDLNVDMFNEKELSQLTRAIDAPILVNQGYKYSSDSKINTMHTGHDRSRLDYILPLNGYKKVKNAVSNVFILRDLTNPVMWNDFDTSDHFPLEALIEFE